MLEAMWNHHPNELDACLGVNPSLLWTAIRADDPKLLALGDSAMTDNWKRTTNPFILHGDG
eukprot:545527-Pyramimonas_sp.AAC.1